MGGSSQDTDLNGMHIRRVTPARSRILNGGGTPASSCCVSSRVVPEGLRT